MNPVQKICVGVYCSGIVVSSLLGIRDELRAFNYRINSSGNHYLINHNVNFAASCFGGAMIGVFVGVLWPLTMIGKGICALDTVSKKEY